VEELRRTRANLIGLVLNRVKPRHSSYYYYSHYYGDHSAGRTRRQGRASAQRRGRGSYIQPKA